MIKVLAFLFLVTSAHAYVPTVESLFRHGSNPDVVANGVSMTLVVKRLAPGESTGPVTDVSLLKDEKAEDYYKIFFTKSGDTLKVAQTHYNSKSFSESSLLNKVYYPNFTPFTIKPGVEGVQKGIFFGVLNSLAYNDGSHIVSYLKSLDVPVKLNNEIINREKVEFLADYKKYLITISKDRNAKKTEVNPMYPEDPAARERANEIMSEPMYVDTKQVSLSKDEGSIAWVVDAEAFKAVFSYKERDLQRVKYKSPAGDFEIILKDYWLANGTHAYPRFMFIKMLNGQEYQVEVLSVRQYVEKEEDLIKRLRNWDQTLKGKPSTDTRPEFLL